MPNFSDLYPSGGGIKSVQRGDVTIPSGSGAGSPIYVDIAISPVNLSNAIARLNMYRSAGGSYAEAVSGVKLISSEVLRVWSSRQLNADSKWYGTGPVTWEVVEWN